MISANIKTLLWDLDGTILDSFGIFRDILGKVLPDYGLELPSVEIMYEHFHGSLDETIAGILGLDTSDKLVERILASFLEVQNSYYEVIDKHIFQDALHLFRKAKQAGLTQIIVSNRDHLNRLNASPRSIVERSELKDAVSFVICGDDSEHRKPKPEVIETLLKDGTVKPAETMMIGDQFVDGLFAKNIGAKAILVQRQKDKIAHLERLGEDWEDYVQVVTSLDSVNLE